MRVRFDVVNLLDRIYELRDGSGMEWVLRNTVSAAAFYGTVSYNF